MRWVAESEVADLPLHPGFAASWQRLRTAPALVPLDRGDERRHHLPRTIEIEAGVFVWCMPGEADQEPSQLSRRISSLLQAPT
jgi:8-oxo-dGTP diphosphatase